MRGNLPTSCWLLACSFFLGGLNLLMPHWVIGALGTIACTLTILSIYDKIPNKKNQPNPADPTKTEQNQASIHIHPHKRDMEADMEA